MTSTQAMRLLASDLVRARTVFSALMPVGFLVDE